jgi:hypothetical protein
VFSVLQRNCILNVIQIHCVIQKGNIYHVHGLNKPSSIETANIFTASGTRAATL